MNFVFILLDQLRADSVGTFGKSIVRTPNLDRLATSEPGLRGVAFENCYVQNPLCTPSRCSIFTGWYPHVRGHRTQNYLLQAEEPNMLRPLREAGYWIEWHGKNDLLTAEAFERSVDHRGAVPGFISTFDGNPYPEGHRLHHSFYFGRRAQEQSTTRDHDWGAAQNAIQFIRERGTESHRSGDRPFMLYLPFIFPHPPYYVEEPYFSMYDRAAVPSPAHGDHENLPSFVRANYEAHELDRLAEVDYREIVATYYGMVTRTDALIGSILSALEEADLTRDTTFIVGSDHGDYTGDYGLVEKWYTGLTDNLTRVPLYIRVPEEAARDRAPGAHPWTRRTAGESPNVSSALIEAIDILPTVMELAGIDDYLPQFGRMLLPILNGDATIHRQAVFSEGGHLPEDIHCNEDVVGKDKLWGIYYPKTILPETHPETVHKAAMVRTERWKYIRRLTGTNELYDLAEDSREERNLATAASLLARPELSAVINDHALLLLQWYMSTADAVPRERDSRDF